MVKNSQKLRQVMGQFATGVTVVTTVDKSGKPFGLTANAFTSLSLEPPLALVCIEKTVHCYSCFDESNVFAASVLSEKQEEISRRFATSGIDKFSAVPWHPGKSGLPLLDGAIAHIECKIVKSYDGGDHTIYVGEVQEIQVEEGQPLIFFHSQYHRLRS